MNTRNSISKAENFASNLKLSALATARATGLTPVKLATALYDDDENADFLAELTAQMIKVKVKKDKEAEAVNA